MCIYIAYKLPKAVQKLDTYDEFPVTVNPHEDKIDLSFLLCPSGMYAHTNVYHMCRVLYSLFYYIHADFGN